MLNFSKINIFFIYFIFLVISFFSILNFQDEEKNFFNKKVNLGLDLQGGSYLLLEIDSDPLIKERIQSKVIPLKKFLKQNGLSFSNFEIKDTSLTFTVNDIEKFELLFFSKDQNTLNPFIDKYNSYELDFKTLKDNLITVFFSKYGITL